MMVNASSPLFLSYYSQKTVFKFEKAVSLTNIVELLLKADDKDKKR
jgi:hypothetical protein